MVVISLASLGVLTLFGDNIKALFGMSADALSGDSVVERRTSSAQGKLEKKKLTNFAAGTYASAAYVAARARGRHPRAPSTR